ncbi:MAG: glucan biosynthesis protein [Opitutaceae bacterium]|nr:glucan biosynthesis protein [Opitutaceae bacterium]
MSRIGLCAWAVGWALAGAGWTGGAEPAFDFAALQARARALATQPRAPLAGEVPDWIRRLSYDELRQIEFDGRESLWRADGLPFQVQFLHPGFLLDKTVRLHEVSSGAVRSIPFRREYFQYRNLRSGAVPDNLGFAGFRLMYPFRGVGTPHQEIGAFAGASYFRFLGEGNAYGLSARGLAVDTAGPGPEEFPVFTEFWLERAPAGAKTMTVYALLDSDSMTGAYRMAVTPGRTTTLHVRATVYCRKNPAIFGVAPLTSMFWHGENSTVPRDFRPEVHDSDGLLVQTGAGEWIWRPLANPARVRVASFSDENPRAFGLLQRDRDFENYQDLEASYHARPSAWIEPVGKWGRGAVRLVEIPTTTEFDDNIVAFWLPEKLPPAGEPIELEYRVHWSLDALAPPAGRVRSTRHGKSAFYEPGLERFVIDFDGAPLQALTAEAKLDPVVTVGAGATFNHASVQKNPINGTWRVAFTVKPDGSGRPVELRCFVRRGGEALSETWSYLWEP